jgi:hypothetical protein
MGAWRGGERARHLALPWIFGKKNQNWNKTEVYQRLKPKIKSTSEKLFFWPQYSIERAVKERERARESATLFQILSYE